MTTNLNDPEKYPEHARLVKIVPQSHAIGEFVEWLNAKGIHLAEWDEERLYTLSTPITTLLAEFFEIDQCKIETEKRAMLDVCREMTP